MPKIQSRPVNRNVVVLAYNGLCTFEFGIAVEIFGIERPEMGPDWYTFQVANVDSGPLRASGGIRILADSGTESLSKAGVVIIPGWKGPNFPLPVKLKEELRKAHARGAVLVSICSGAQVLAEIGLLDGKRATTHWRYIDQFAKRYPDVHWQPDVLYVDEGQVLTSAGSAAGIDLCLHLVRRDFGTMAANRVARRLVLPTHRDGGQAQFIEQPVLSVDESARLSPLIERLRRRLHVSHAISDLARESKMSQRTFIRRFMATTGLPPGRWLTRERVRLASQLLESTRHPVKSIAEKCGLQSEATLRHHFRRTFGISPGAYRQKFGDQGATRR